MGEAKAQDILSEINTATLENSEAGKNIGINEAKKLIERILEYQKNNKSPFLDGFLKNLISDYNNLETKTEEEKNSIFSNTSRKLENIKIELEKKAIEEDKKIKEDADKLTNDMIGASLEQINSVKFFDNSIKDNEKYEYTLDNIRKKLRDYLMYTPYDDKIKKMLEGLTNTNPEIFEDSVFTGELLKINSYYSEFIEEPKIVNDILGNWNINGYFVLTKKNDILKEIIDESIKSVHGFENLITKTDLFIKDVNPEIQKYLLNLANENEQIYNEISHYMYKFNNNLIPEKLKNKSGNETTIKIKEYLKGKNIKNINEADANYIITIINQDGSYINNDIKLNYLNPVKEYILKNPNFKFDLNNSNIIKGLEDKNPNSNDYKLTKILQNRILKEIFDGQIHINSEFLKISLEKGYTIIDEKEIEKRFFDFDKLLLKLGNNENNKNILEAFSLFGRINETFKNGKERKFDELLKKAGEKFRKFEKIDQNKIQITDKIDDFYKKNKELFKDDINIENFRNLPFTSFDSYLKNINKLLKKELSKENFDEIANFFIEIIDLKIEENNKITESYFKEIKPSLREKLFKNGGNGEKIELKDKIDNKIDNILTCNNNQCSISDIKNILISETGGKKEYDSLKKDEKLILDKIIESKIEVKKLEIEKKQAIRAKENDNLQKIYIDYANGKIDEKIFQEQKTEINKEIDKKEKIIQTSAQVGLTITNEGQSYFIKSGDEKIDLSYDEAQKIGNDPEKVKAVLKFKNELDDLGLGFLWNDREILFQNVKNYFKKDDAINIFDGDITVFEMTNLLDYIRIKINGPKKENLEDYKEYFKEIKRTKIFNDKVYNNIDNEKIFIEIFKDKSLFTENTINLKKDI